MLRSTLISSLLILLVASCNTQPDMRRLPCVPARGELFIGGQAATGAELLFQPQSMELERWNGVYPRATVRDDGSFEIETYLTPKGGPDGAPEGDYVVLVKWMTTPTVPAGERPRDDHAPYDRLLGKYNNPATTKLRAKVVAPQTWLPRINL